MKTIWFWFVLGSTPIQASSFQEYCSNAKATVKIAQGHIANEVSVTERIPKDWAFVEKKLVLPNAFVGVLEEQKIEKTTNTVCEGKWGVFYWHDVSYKKVRVVQSDGAHFSGNVLGVSKDGTYVEDWVICEEFGNSETMCEDSPDQRRPGSLPAFNSLHSAD